MSHTDYNSLSNKAKAETPENETITSNENLELVNQDETPESTNQVESPDKLVDPETEPDYITGKVIDCTKLNMRKQPSINADILCTFAKDSTVLIDMATSIGDWYKVCIGEKEGFCMKKYIAIDT